MRIALNLARVVFWGALAWALIDHYSTPTTCAGEQVFYQVYQVCVPPGYRLGVEL